MVVAGRWGWQGQRDDASVDRAGPLAVVGSILVLGAAVVLPIVLPLVVLWVALPALSADGKLLAEGLAGGGVGGGLAYAIALAQWLLTALLALAVQQWAWVLIAGLGLLVMWVLRRG